MDQESAQSLHRRGSKASRASGNSVVKYEPFAPDEQFQTREIPTINIDPSQTPDYHEGKEEPIQDAEEDPNDPLYEANDGVLRPRFTTDTFDSSYTNTRTNTYDQVNTNDDSYLYRGSVDRREETDNIVPDRLNDKIPSSRPNVDYQDKLWTQIDVLDDVKRMSEQTTVDNNSFFNVEHSKAINELRLAQVELLSTIKNSEKLVDSNFDHTEIWDSKNIEGIRDKLYNKEYFDSIANSVDKVKDRLDNVGQSMKKIDELTKDIWQD